MRTIKAIIAVAVVLNFCGCGSVAPYHFPDTGAPADLHAVNATRVTVKKEFRYSPTLTSYVLPEGDYVPVRLAAGGTYYESPRGILVLPAAGSSFLVRGGIYRRNETKTSYPFCVYLYMPVGGLTFVDLHSLWGLNLNEKIECEPVYVFK